MKASRLRWLMNVWPPLAFSGIHITEFSDDYRRVRVELRQRWYNRNYVGAHFGGSLFAMTDPFWMMMLLHCLGREYIVWDQASEISFVKPGHGTVTAVFQLDDDVIEAIQAATAQGEKYLHWFEVDVLDHEGGVVARVRKQLYVRRKRSQPNAAAGGAR